MHVAVDVQEVANFWCEGFLSVLHAAHERAATQEAGAWQLVREAEEDLENRNRALESARQEQEVRLQRALNPS